MSSTPVRGRGIDGKLLPVALIDLPVLDWA
jgi:hypothetical protein